MRKMRYTRNIIVAALLLAVWLPAWAQSPNESKSTKFAGEDKVILRLHDNTQTVQIGEEDPHDHTSYCYKWSGNNIQDDIDYKAVITVMPLLPEQTYFVRRVSDCNGIERDQVKVTVVDTISIVSVTPTRCYQDGDTIRREHFKIVTLPEGYESMVKVTPVIAHHPDYAEKPEWQQAVNFRLEYNNHTSHKSATVSVMNDEKPLTISFSPEFQNFEENISKAEEVLEHALRVKDELRKELKVPLAPDPPCDINYNITGMTVPTFSCYCCEGNKVGTFSLPQFSVSGSLGCEWSWPVPYLSIPFAGTGLYLVGGFNVGLNMGPTYIVWRGKCSYVDLPVELFAEGFGGIRLQVLTKDLLSASGLFTLSGRYAFSWHLGHGKPFESGALKCRAELNGEVKVLSGMTFPYNLELGEFIVDFK